MSGPKKTPLNTGLPSNRKLGQTALIRSIAVGGSIKVHPERVSTPNNLHSLANRLGMKVAVRQLTEGKHAGKLEVFRLK